MKKNVYIYCDEGAGAFSVYSARDYFSNDNVTLIKADELIRDGIPEHVDLFLIPGGADRPYAKKLNGIGNKNIRQYVENGGTYLGICAGAYYGCNNIEFQKNTPHEICEDRELKFCDGTAVGCLNEIAPLYDQTLRSATITNIEINNISMPMLYWGGCYFKNLSNAIVIGHYEDIKGKPPAIVSCSVGKGRALLYGAHFEISAKNLNDFDFGNEQDNTLKIAIAEQLNTTDRLSINKIIEGQRT